jgi:hypothetical protein
MLVPMSIDLISAGFDSRLAMFWLSRGVGNTGRWRGLRGGRPEGHRSIPDSRRLSLFL